MVEPFPERPASDTDVLERDQAPAAAAAEGEEGPPAKRPSANPAVDPFPASSDSEDEELEVLGDSGEVPTRDYPHCRTDCAVHTFLRTVLSKKQQVPGNAQHCPQCYCYVCDKPADQCQSWGTGSSPWDHCHAYDDTQVVAQSHWRDLRMVRRHRGHDAMMARQAAAMGLPAHPGAAAGAGGGVGGGAPGAGSSSGAGALRSPPGAARRGRGRPPLRRSTGPSWMVQSSISRFYAPVQQQEGADKAAGNTAAAAAAGGGGGGGQAGHDRPSPMTISSDSSQEEPQQQQQQEGDQGGRPEGAMATPSRARRRQAGAELLAAADPPPPPAAAAGGPGAAGDEEAALQKQQQRVASPRQRSSRGDQPEAAAAAAAKVPPAPAAPVVPAAGQRAGEELPPGHSQLGLVRVYCNYSPPDGWVGSAWASTVKMLAGERAFVWQPGAGWIAANAFEEASGKGNCRKWRDTLWLHLPSGGGAAAAAGGAGAGPEQLQPTRKDCVRAGAWLDQHGLAARKRGRAATHAGSTALHASLG